MVCVDCVCFCEACGASGDELFAGAYVASHKTVGACFSVTVVCLYCVESGCACCQCLCINQPGKLNMTMTTVFNSSVLWLKHVACVASMKCDNLWRPVCSMTRCIQLTLVGPRLQTVVVDRCALWVTKCFCVTCLWPTNALGWESDFIVSFCQIWHASCLLHPLNDSDTIVLMLLTLCAVVLWSGWCGLQQRALWSREDGLCV